MSFSNIDTAKSYSSEDNLMKALTKLGLHECHPLVVRNREGRFTAIFHAPFVEPVMAPIHVAQLGFKIFV
jgi:hypothetical protein